MNKVLIPALLLVLVSVVLGATVFQAPLASAAAGIPSMFVANDKQHPLPVEEQNLDADGNIKVHEQGTVTVGVRGTPTVKVVADEPFERALNIACDGYCSGGFDVPEGKRLTLKYISASAGSLVYVAVYKDPESPRAAYAPAVERPTGDFEIGIVSEEILFFAEPGSTVFVSALGIGTVQVYLAGSLSDA